MGWILVMIWSLAAGIVHAERLRRSDIHAESKYPKVEWLFAVFVFALIAPFIFLGWAALRTSQVVTGDV